MSAYDFATLSPYDFEELTRDLLQAQFGLVLQSFKSGRDGGVDLRYARDETNIVVQCKHLRKSGFKALLRQARAEADKIARFDPPANRYILATTVELSDREKRDLAAILGARDTGDILGAADLNNLLALHEQIETAHYKLWLTSTAVLQRVLHNAEATQSTFEFSRIRKRIPRFVQSRAYDLARAQLERDRILILSGLPGVGKTTLAEMLLYEAFADGFEPIVARNGLGEARTLLKDGVKQVICYDDFLGATYLGEGGSALVQNEDRAISDFIDMVAEDDTKRLILTTREHLLSQALEASERLTRTSVGRFRYVLAIGTYTPAQRARILYNHVWFNSLPRRYRDELVRQDFHVEIVEHPRFSPRLVDSLTTLRRIESCPPAGYQAFVRRLLNDPTEIWRFAYDRQIGEPARSLLLALHGLEGRASHERLSTAFEQLNAVRATRYGFRTRPDDFHTALRELADAFTVSLPDAVVFVDPSVRDLLNAVLTDTPNNGVDMIRGAVSMTQVGTVWGLARRSEGARLLRLLVTEADTLLDGIRRGLAAPVAFVEPGYSGTYRPAIEERLLLLVEISIATGARGIIDLIVPAAKRALFAWRHGLPDLVTAIRAIRRLADVQADHVELEALTVELRSGLMAQTRYGMGPAEVLALMGLAPAHPLSDPDVASLKLIAGQWAQTIGDRLRDCRSAESLTALGEQMAIVARRLEVDLRGPLQAVKTELEMYVEDIPEVLETSWMVDPVREERSAKRALAELFGSLNSEED